MNRAVNKRLDPSLLGTILLARILELPLKKFERYVETLDSDPSLPRLAGFVESGYLKGATLVSLPPSDVFASGEILSNGIYPVFLYHRVCCIREYRFDDVGMKTFLRDGSGNEDLRKVVRRLRLVNTRNRLAQALVEHLLREQADFLVSGSPVRLRPLTQADVSRALSSAPSPLGRLDPSRLSRLLRHFPVVFPDGRVRPLGDLCPSRRDVCCHFVDHVIKNEKMLMHEGLLPAPLSDGEMARHVEEAFGVCLSRRTISRLRRVLGIPAKEGRVAEENYREATGDFSLPLPLTPPSVRETVPEMSGVYEIRSFLPGVPEEVVYIGSAANLKRRLSYHLYVSGGSPCLRDKISAGARFRYRIFKEDWRTQERLLYRAFLNTFGRPPDCNRVSP
ncbi:MAG: hypothetical protein M0041_00955 [Nitrospiraceae bacterium]|nr:hypothetical protein [Nitrospiraceae bacterium]